MAKLQNVGQRMFVVGPAPGKNLGPGQTIEIDDKLAAKLAQSYAGNLKVVDGKTAATKPQKAAQKAAEADTLDEGVDSAEGKGPAKAQ